jgi:hypothetical protein
MNRFDACDELSSAGKRESYPTLKRRTGKLDEALLMQPGTSGVS